MYNSRKVEPRKDTQIMWDFSIEPEGTPEHSIGQEFSYKETIFKIVSQHLTKMTGTYWYKCESIDGKKKQAFTQSEITKFKNTH